MLLRHRLIGRPTTTKAVLCSIFLHLGSLSAAAYVWSAAPLEHFSASGEREAIYLDASLVDSQPSQQVVVHLESDLTPLFDRSEPEPTSAIELELTPLELPLAKTRNEAEVERERPEDEVLEVVDFGELVAHVATRKRAPEVAVDVTREKADSNARLPRQTPQLPTPASTKSVQQVAGVENKDPPDFAGNLPPVYPADAIRQRLEGTVLLRMYVSSQGLVERVEVATSSGHAILDRAAMEAVRRWRGRPARRSGRAVDTVEVMPIRFRLDD